MRVIIRYRRFLMINSKPHTITALGAYAPKAVTYMIRGKMMSCLISVVLN